MGKGRKRWVNRWKAPLNAFELAFPGRLNPAESKYDNQLHR
jgi:putative transposase